MEYAENIVQLLANLIALLLCLFHYISNKRRGWFIAIVFFLCNLLSCYYWTAYLVIMGDWPNVMEWMTYSGWNAAFFVLFVLLMYQKSKAERRFFHPLMLIPVPLNIFQLTLYLPYGNLLNNIYQVAIGTLLSVFSLQGILWYRKNRENGALKPYISVASLIFISSEFGMWTSSCLYEPFADFYYVFSFLCSMDYLFIVWCISRTFADQGQVSSTTFDLKYQRILKASYLGLMLVGSVGGVLLGFWMRNVMTQHIDQASETNAYDVIPVVLFVISLILMIFTVAVIFIVYFGQKAAENNELREARRVAEQSSAAKSEFLANMSHEIRTPINAVMGMNEIVLRESTQARKHLPEDSEQIRGIFADISSYAGIINNAGKNLLSIINDILDISRIEAGKLEIRENEYRLSSVLNDVCGLIRFRAQSRNLSFRAEVAEDLPDRLFGDGIRVRQILLNLLNNAVKYTVRGSVTLSAACKMKDHETVELVLAVRDTGVGIRREDLDRLFEKFERLSPEDDTGVEGTGLGLPIVKSLLDMMGGRIEVESVYGDGSVFTVFLPQKIVSAEPIGNFREQFENCPESSVVSPDLFHAPEARILIVDDTRMNLTVTEGLLKNTEAVIDTAVSGAEALRLTLSVSYDLILMDQRMPEMDGTEALSLIRAQEGGANRQTPIVCLTADAVAGAREKYLAEGFSDYLTKPVNTKALRRTLMKYLPKEKILSVADPAPESSVPADEARFAPLRSAGIDVSQGLSYCQQDHELYRTVLWEYSCGAGEKAALLQQYFDAGDWNSYAIRIHALKSTSGTIGASRLSEMAARLEQAAKQEDADTVRKEHAEMLTLYKQTAGAILSVCTEESALPAENDGVIEFMPDE